MLIKLYSWLQKFFGFKRIGCGSVIKGPWKIWRRDCLEIGNNTFVAENSFFAITKLNKEPLIKIGDNCCLGANFFAACVDEIIIESNVLVSDRVFISDHMHGYQNVELPIIRQTLEPRGQILIKDGAFIGVNAVIMPGVTIGKNSVVGASSVVVDSVPDFSVVAGNPARIIKQYDFNKKEWLGL